MIEGNEKLATELKELAKRHELKFVLVGTSTHSFSFMTCPCAGCTTRFTDAMTTMLLEMGKGKVVAIDPKTGKMTDAFPPDNSGVIH